jgi:RNA polymerase sigma-70 factor (ECF subfamily)
VEELVRRAQRGDTDAMNALLTEIAPYVGRICGAVALDAGEDATQEALVAIFRNLPSLRDAVALRAWARRIAVREALRSAGNRRSVPVDPITLEAAVASPDLSGDVDVRTVLASLDPVHRVVLVLRHLDGLDEREMASVLDVAPGTVKSRLHRARVAFRARWSA